MERVRHQPLWPECLTLAAEPAFEALLAAIQQAEQKEGWLCVCEAQSQYLLPCEALLNELAAALERLAASYTAPGGADAPGLDVLEVAAGKGTLAAALRRRGLAVVATDSAPPAGAQNVEVMSAIEALETFKPGVVLGSFVPFDAGIEQAIFSTPSVKACLLLNARLGGQFGHEMLWRQTDWDARPLPRLTRWMITRHDVWMGPNQPLIQLGEAWLFLRK